MHPDEKECQVWTDTWPKRDGKWQMIATQDNQGSNRGRAGAPEVSPLFRTSRMSGAPAVGYNALSDVTDYRETKINPVPLVCCSVR